VKLVDGSMNCMSSCFSKFWIGEGEEFGGEKSGIGMGMVEELPVDRLSDETNVSSTL
jgi:hypothetical protein